MIKLIDFFSLESFLRYHRKQLLRFFLSNLHFLSSMFHSLILSLWFSFRECRFFLSLLRWFFHKSRKLFEDFFWLLYWIWFSLRLNWWIQLNQISFKSFYHLLWFCLILENVWLWTLKIEECRMCSRYDLQHFWIFFVLFCSFWFVIDWIKSHQVFCTFPLTQCISQESHLSWLLSVRDPFILSIVWTSRNLHQGIVAFELSQLSFV